MLCPTRHTCQIFFVESKRRAYGTIMVVSIRLKASALLFEVPGTSVLDHSLEPFELRAVRHVLAYSLRPAHIGVDVDSAWWVIEWVKVVQIPTGSN